MSVLKAPTVSARSDRGTAARSFRFVPYFLGITVSVLVAAAACGQGAASFDTALGLEYVTGRALFEKNWVSAPASTDASDGLGPLYNARSCAACHRGGGAGTLQSGLVLRTADPVYGRQIQERAVPGMAGEATVTVDYDNRTVSLAGGERVTLQVPRYGLADPQYGPPSGAGLSPRLAPPLAGSGLLERVPEPELAKLADPGDRDGDGISGRLADVAGSPGRFGWKAEQPDIPAQVAAALHLDIGIGSAARPDGRGDCTPAQQACGRFATGDSARYNGLEAGDALVDNLVYFVRHMPPPEAGAGNPATRRGAALFREAGCAACHRPALPTDSGTIHPYSDLLLHDMGPALADTLNDPAVYASDAAAGEWRTPPLWGLGAGTRRYYLHDGRARTVLEAVLWHGGEAQAARDRVAAMNSRERADLLAFLHNL